MIIKLKSVTLHEAIMFRGKADPRGTQTRSFVASDHLTLTYDSAVGLVELATKAGEHRFIPVSNITEMTVLDVPAPAPAKK